MGLVNCLVPGLARPAAGLLFALVLLASVRLCGAQAIPLNWDPGTAEAGTEVIEQSSETTTDFLYRIRSQNPASGAWRTVLRVMAGNADLFFRRAQAPDPAIPAASDFKSTRTTGDDGFILNPAGQFVVGEDYYIVVRSYAGASWRLSSGEAFIHDLGALGYGDENGNAKFDPGESVEPQTAGARTIGGEGVLLYRATVPEGVPAWSLWLNGLNNKIAVRKNFVPFQTVTAPVFNVEKTGRMLLVPDYLQASTAGSAYFLSVAGNPGTVVNLDSRIHTFTDIEYDSTTEITGAGPGFRTFRVSVPPNQPAWSVSMTPVSGDPHVCLRRDKVASGDDNNGYSEVNSATVADSITLSPASSGSAQEGLTDGTFFVTVYSSSGDYTGTLRSGPVQVTDIAFQSVTVNDAPARAGWRFYRVSDIESQTGLGWELELTDRAAGTEIAIRRNAVPSRWLYRTNGTPQSSTGILNMASTSGLLQNPRHQRDVWYVGVFQPSLPLGEFTLYSGPMSATPLEFADSQLTLSSLTGGRSYYWRVTVPPHALGWKLDLTRLLPVSGTGDADCTFAVARDVLPSLHEGELNIPQEVGVTDLAWPGSRQLKIDRSRDLVPLDKDGDQSRRYSVIIPMGHPLEPGNYFVGIRPKTVEAKVELASRGIGEGAGWPIGIGSMDVTGAGAVPALTPLALGDAAFFKTTVPPGMHAWELTLDAPAGECLLAVQRGVLPGMSGREAAAILRPGTSSTIRPAAIMARRNGAERLLLMESNGQTEIPPGDYYLAVLSQGTPAGNGQPLGAVEPVLRSEGELPVESIGDIGATPVARPFALAAGQISAWEFTLPAGLTAAEVSVESASGHAVAAWWAGPAPRFPQPGKETDRYGYEGGEPDATGAGGVRQRITNNSKQVLVHPNPAAGTYRLLLRAAIRTGSTYEPAAGTLTIRQVGQTALPFDGGTATVTEQPEESWSFFAFDVPGSGALLGWDLRVENARRTNGVLSTSPEVVIRRDIPPPGGAALNTSSTDWRSGEFWNVQSDWTKLDLNLDGSRHAGVVLPAGRPLKGGRYLVGVKARSAATSYTLRSRGIGEGFSIPVTPLLPSPNAAARLTVNDLLFREAAYFKIELTGAAPENLLVIADALAATTDFRLALRRDGLPGTGASPNTNLAAPHGVMASKNESGEDQPEEELYIALPPSGQATLPAGVYYAAVISEGDAEAGTPAENAVDFTIGAVSPIPIEDLGSVPGTGEVLVQRPFSLRPGAIAVFQADIAPNSTGRSAGLAPYSGISGLAVNSGVTDRLPRPVTTPNEGYGLEGGDLTGGYIATIVGTGLCQDIPDGISRFVVRALPGSTGWKPATGIFYIGNCEAFPLLDCNGGTHSGNLLPRSWMHYKIIIPEGLHGWDLKCLSSRSLDLVIRRTVPAENVTATVTHASTAWPPQGVYAVTGDWTNRPSSADGSSFLWSVLPMGAPLEPGTYYIGLRNNSDLSAAYAISSGAIGPGLSIPLEPLEFSGEGTATVPLAPKTARYFSITVPAGQRSWEIDSQVTNGDVLLAVRKDRIPGSKADAVSQGPYAGHGLAFDKPGHERLVLLPPSGQEFLAAGEYYAAVVSRGAGATNTRTGALPAEASFRSSGEMPVVALGTVNGAQPVSRPLTFSEAQIRAYEFDITESTPGVEVRLDDRSGLPRLALWTGDARFLPEPPLASPNYGFWGGTKTTGTSIRHEQDAIYTMANVAPGRYRLVLRACPSGSSFPAAACRLSISVKPHLPLAFGPLLETPALSSRHQAHLVKGQKNLYSVSVPALYNGQDVLGWQIYVRQLSGTTGLRAFRLSGVNAEIAVTGQNSLLLAPPWFTPGQTWYFSVDGEGVAEYEVESRPVQLAQAPWVLPGAHGLTFGDSAPSAAQPEKPLAQDDWHFYAVTIPDNNAGVLRTMLESISGNPDLYLRSGAIPTADHKVSGTTGNDLFDRRLNGLTTEYGNWVPDKGRAETQLPPATWYLGVRASGARNASYRLRASSATVTPLSQSGGSVTGDSLAGGDWRYYLFAPPAEAPAVWRLHFHRSQGNAVFYIRDTVPPGDFNAAGAVRHDATDSKNSGPYQSGGYTQPGVYTCTSPVLRAGHRYWVGVRALSDAQYSLSSSVEGSLAAVPVLPFNNGTFNEPLAPGESRLFRVVVPPGSTRLSANFNGTGGFTELRVEQASPPSLTGANHLRSNNGSISRTLGMDPNTQWPWISGYDFYLRLTNTGTVERAPGLVLTGLAPVAPDSDDDGLADAWERANFNNALTAGALDDPDKDGLVNLLEFALGTPPQNPSRTTQPVVVRLDAAGRLVMEVAKPAATDLTTIRYRVEFSSNLTDWTAAGVTLEDTAAVLEVRDSVSAATQPGRHVRLRVTRAGAP